jgi:translocation and assembly module TamB
MKRRLLIGLSLILILGFSLWFGYFLFFTSEGVPWILKGVSWFSPLTLRAEKWEGRLAGNLRLEGLQAGWKDGRLRVHTWSSRLTPGRLLQGKIFFEEIKASGVIVEQLQQRTEPLDLSWPRPGGFLTRLNSEVRFLEIQELSYRTPDNPVRHLQAIQGSLIWNQGILALSQLSLKSDLGRLEGDLGLGFRTPALKIDLKWAAERPWQGMEQFLIQGRLGPDWKGMILTGPLQIRGLKEGKERFIFQSQLGIAPHRIDIRKIVLRESGRKGFLGGEGAVLLDEIDPSFQARMKLTDLDFSREVGTAVTLSGQVRLKGKPAAYSGTFDLIKKGPSWQAARLAGDLQGNQAGFNLAIHQGQWLKGSLQGRLEIDWAEGISLEGSLQGRDLRTEVFHPRLPGLINLEARGKYVRRLSGLNQASFILNLPHSRFQGKSLAGMVKARIDHGALLIDQAGFSGAGFSFSGRGNFSEGLKVEARVSDLSLLLPDGAGSFTGTGWLRWRNNLLGTGLTLSGKGLRWKSAACQDLKLEALRDPEKTGTSIKGTARIQGMDSPYFKAQSLLLEISGTQTLHRVNLSLIESGGKWEAGLSGTYQQKEWTGTIQNFSVVLPGAPPLLLRSAASFKISSRQLQIPLLILAGKEGEQVTIKTDLGLKPLIGDLSSEWQNIDLARTRPFLKKTRVSGKTSGRLQTVFLANHRLDLVGRVGLSGVVQQGNRRLEVTRGVLDLSWNGKGLRSSWDLQTRDGGRLQGQAGSKEKGRPAFPEQGKFTLTAAGLDPDLFYPLKVRGFQVRGRIGGQAEGEWTRGPRFTLRGRMGFSRGSLHWQEKEAAFETRIKTAEVGLLWSGDLLQGDLDLELEEYGKIKGDFRLPLPARIPLKLQTSAALEVNARGTVRERGLLTSLFPEALQTSRGLIQAQLSVRGTWEKPDLSGNLNLTDAGADILPLGLQIRNVSAEAAFNQNRITLTKLHMVSGPGSMEGKAVFRLQGWKISEMEGTLTGNRFQFINRPGIRALANPALKITGPAERLNLSGTMEIPEAFITGGQAPGFKQASSDVRVIDSKAPSGKGGNWPVQGEIQLRLGHEVRLKAGGLDAYLQGGLSVGLNGTQSLRTRGEIQVSRGHYLLQNQKLEITRGRFSFKGDPENPSLDLLALRTIPGRQRLGEITEDIQAGISVTGTLENNQVKLYSRPPLSETDILSYILFGEPLKSGTGRQNLALISQAAGVLVGGNLQDKLTGLFKLDTIEVQSEKGDLSRSVITVGKYLNPRLFLGLGGSLFDNSYQVILRYSLTPRLEIETKSGSHSSGGIFFKMDFE